MTSPYDDIPTGQFVKWEEPGQQIVGDLVLVEAGQSLQGTKVPQLTIRLDSGEEVIVTASQGQLKALILKEKPLPGDRVRIKFTNTEKRDGGKTLKLFELEVKRGGAKAAVAVASEDF